MKYFTLVRYGSITMPAKMFCGKNGFGFITYDGGWRIALSNQRIVSDRKFETIREAEEMLIEIVRYTCCVMGIRYKITEVDSYAKET